MSTTVNYKGNTIATLSNETKILNTAGTWVEGDIEVVDTKDSATLQSKTATPTESTQTIAPDTGYDGLSSVEVGAISSTYVGSGISRKSSADLTEEEIVSENSGLLITAPSGYYSSDATKLIPDAGSPITNSISYSRGYIRISFDIPSAGYIPEVEDLLLDSIYITDIQGLPIITNEDITVSSDTVIVPSGWCNSSFSKTVASGTATTPATSITANPSISVSSGGLITATTSASQSVTPTVNAGYVTSGTSGTVSVSGSNTQQLTTQAAKTVTPTESEQTAVAANVYTTGIVKVGAISSTYVGSGITQRDDTDLTVSDATVTVPSGYYASDETKTVASGSASTPATAITTNPSITVSSSGLITATASASQSVTPTVSAGYVSSGTAGTVTVSGSKTQQLTTKGATTITPTKSSQTAVASGVYTTGAITVAAIPNNYITTTDATASASDILSGETAYVNGSKVTGTLIFSTVTVSSSTPSGGSSGDIWIQV